MARSPLAPGFIDEDRLPQFVPQSVREHARDQIKCATCTEWHHHGDGLRRKTVLRRSWSCGRTGKREKRD
jgi:hypothetical protein